jgi:hypothetical protein
VSDNEDRPLEIKLSAEVEGMGRRDLVLHLNASEATDLLMALCTAMTFNPMPMIDEYKSRKDLQS